MCNLKTLKTSTIYSYLLVPKAKNVNLPANKTHYWLLTICCNERNTVYWRHFLISSLTTTYSLDVHFRLCQIYRIHINSSRVLTLFLRDLSSLRVGEAHVLPNVFSFSFFNKNSHIFTALRYDRFLETRQSLVLRVTERSSTIFCDEINLSDERKREAKYRRERVQPRIRASQWSRPNCSRAKARWNSTTFHSEAEAARFEWSCLAIGWPDSDVTALIVPRTPHHVAHRRFLSPSFSSSPLRLSLSLPLFSPSLFLFFPSLSVVFSARQKSA